MKFKIDFIISNLNTGGAEMMLFKLLSRLDRKIFSAKVISLTDTGTIGKKFEQIDVQIEALGLHRGIPDPRGIYWLASSFRKTRPNLVQTWMYHADLMGGLAAKLAGNFPVVWNIRNGTLDPDKSKKTTILTAKTCAKISRLLPDKIICCSEVAMEVHANLGYDASKMILIPNGFDLKLYSPNSTSRREIFEELKIPMSTIVIGLVARFDPQKDHKNFIQAALMLKNKINDVNFILCGEGITWENKKLSSLIEKSNHRSSFHLLGRRMDIDRITASFDIACSSSSYGEAFSNVVGEAMACAVPCVVTEVGDSGLIVGDTGRVVPPCDPQALAAALQELIELGPEQLKQLGSRARDRVEQEFSLDQVVKKYQDLYTAVLD